MTNNSATIRVGRLLEISVRDGYKSAADVDEMITMIRAAVSGLPPSVKHVTFADWRACQVMMPAAVEHARQMLVGANARTERSAILATRESPTAVMQFFRLVHEAEHPGRRVFHEPLELAAWLSEVLSPAEAARLRSVLGEPVGRRST